MLHLLRRTTLLNFLNLNAVHEALLDYNAT